MLRPLIFALSLCATTAAAQGFPDAFVVSGVSADDTLNIRSEPSASSTVIGEYGPYTLNIEVLRTSPDGKWGMVGVPEGNGWVSMRYLERSGHNVAGEFFRPMTCFGTEPFWNLNVTVRGDEYQMMGDDRRDLNLIRQNTAPDGAYAIFEEGPTLNRILIVDRGYCSDGMSDREYGWRATLFNEAPDGNSVESGCCTLDGNY